MAFIARDVIVTSVEVVEVTGYLVRLMPKSIGGVPVLKAVLAKLNGEHVVVTLFNPPEWLRLGLALECRCMMNERDRSFTAEEVRQSGKLEPATMIEVRVEEVTKAVDGSLLVSGVRSDGRYFSARLSSPDVMTPLRSGEKAIGIFVEKGVIQNLIAIIPLGESSLFDRVSRLLREALRPGDEHPEREYLANAIDR